MEHLIFLYKSNEMQNLGSVIIPAALDDGGLFSKFRLTWHLQWLKYKKAQHNLFVYIY